MAGATTHYKLGVFVLAAIAGAFAIAFALGLRGARGATITYHTYFDEAVDGLEIGARVRYRGVRIGTVAAIGVAPDRRHVDVSLALLSSELRGLDLAMPELRTELGNQGVTGLKFVSVDFATDAEPPESLPFPPADHYLRSRTSLIKRLTDASEVLGRDSTTLVRTVTATMRNADAVLGDVRDQRLAAHLAKLADQAGDTIAQLGRAVQHVDRANVPAKALAALDRVIDAATGVRHVLDRIDGDDGLAASARRATDAIGAVGRGTLGSAEELERTLRDLGDAARVVRDFVDALEREPDMLLKGRDRPRGP